MKLNSKTLKQQLNLKGNPEILIKIDNSDEIISIPWEIFFRDVLQLVSGYVPLAGTEVNNSITGLLHIELLNSIRWVNTNGDFNSLSFENGFLKVSKSDPSNTLISTVSFNTINGLESSNYFGANTGETYVQKKYVDITMIPLDYGTIENVGGIENVQVYTTGVGTGIASVDLSPTMAIGKDITVSDLGNNASTHNIQIDAGVGNSILYNGVASQDITLSTDGKSITLRKMTATQWMAI